MGTRLDSKSNWFWSRRSLLLALGFSSAYLFSLVSKGFARSLEKLELQSPPEFPDILTLDPLEDFLKSESSPIFSFADNTVPRQWWYATPVIKGLGKKVVAQLQRDRTDRPLEKVLKPLESEKLVPESWPDFTDAIDLKALGNERPEIYSLFYTIVSNERSRLLRVCHGVAGPNVKAQMWVAGVPVQHGELLRVRAGLYPLVVEAYHGKRTQWLPWKLARLATRLTEVSSEEVEEVYQWQLARWQKNRQMALANEEQLLATIKFDLKTVRGQPGFFRVAQSVNGKWWLLAPNGKAFYHRGCTGLNAGGMGGRRANLPPVPESTARKWITYLKEWGFNALGAWTTSEFFNKGMPFTEIIETFYEKPWLIPKFPDVWDPQWSNNVDAKCKKLCTPLKNNKNLIGYFLDNERGFMAMLRSNETFVANAPTYRSASSIPEESLPLPAEPKLNPKGIGLLQFSLSQNPGIPAGEKAWNFVLQRHGSLENLSQAWQIEIPSRNTLKDLTQRGEILISPGYFQDHSDFVTLWVEKYYKICREKIHKYDPNHLLLGTRWGGTPSPSVIKAERKWADVVSRNNYRANFYELFDEFYQQVQLPILNGEISTWTDSFTLIRNPIEPPGGYSPDTRRILRQQETLERIFSHPGTLGYTKYRWHGSGGDKLWNDGPQWHVIKTLQQLNSRAVSIATYWDRPPVKSETPLHGQFFITLLDAAVKVNTLPPAYQSDLPSKKLRTQPLAIGLVCYQGQWAPSVYGNGIQGEVIQQTRSNKLIKLTLQLRQSPTLVSSSKALAKYTLKLTPNDTKLEGTFRGHYNFHPVKGQALGYLHRPVPTIRF
ncbi:MAG: hypothetical protein QNJ54_35135 [Prochloraceae cyanobacterium]|nr:hypothetical protein [Prochloraceae cyanobacterium]